MTVQGVVHLPDPVSQTKPDCAHSPALVAQLTHTLAFVSQIRPLHTASVVQPVHWPLEQTWPGQLYLHPPELSLL